MSCHVIIDHGLFLNCIRTWAHGENIAYDKIPRYKLVMGKPWRVCRPVDLTSISMCLLLQALSSATENYLSILSSLTFHATHSCRYLATKFSRDNTAVIEFVQSLSVDHILTCYILLIKSLLCVDTQRNKTKILVTFFSNNHREYTWLRAIFFWYIILYKSFLPKLK